MKIDPWIEQNMALVPAAGLLLDLACGRGRHTEFALQQGISVLAVDRDISSISAQSPRLETLSYDLEAGSWPFPANFFDGILVCNYLHRPLMPYLRSSLRAGGVLIYTTFMEGNEAYGKPSNPDYLLRENELRETFGLGFTELRFAQGPVNNPATAVRQSICVRKDADNTIVSS